MPKYRKKPIVIEAEVYHKGLEDGFDKFNWNAKTDKWDLVNAWFTAWGSAPANSVPIPFIDTLEGKHYISPKDFIITGVKGERYPCKPDIFRATYERVKD